MVLYIILSVAAALVPTACCYYGVKLSDWAMRKQAELDARRRNGK